jgi:hypothetical protein|tara:strand:+ start:426 stop:596 length:171 start_codon:yes stop_codon:yes gene_type:complete
MEENDFIRDKLCEEVFPELDAMLDRESTNIMSELNISVSMMKVIVEAWIMEKEKQL